MVICFDATAEAKRALDSLTQTGQFRDISEAISMALVNYEILQRSIPEDGRSIFSAPFQPQPEEPRRTESTKAVAQPSNSRGDIQSERATPTIPQLFGLKKAGGMGADLLSMPTKPRKGNTKLPPANWLFGQYNKFLPLKAACRGLLNLFTENPSGIPINEAASTISFAACGLGDYLLALDDRYRLRREDACAAAFPSSAIDDTGSRSRFGNQFVANMKQGQPSGFPVALRFATTDDRKQPLLILTKAGAEFAALPNPVLDGSIDAPARKLSEAEITFLLAHISGFVPEETSAYLAILDAVEAEANTPDNVDKYLRQRFKLPTEKEITKTFLTTQRTGAISRMVDLGLLAREKQGLRVTYMVTHPGKSFRSQIA
jgi:hypothetical protein